METIELNPIQSNHSNHVDLKAPKEGNLQGREVRHIDLESQVIVPASGDDCCFLLGGTAMVTCCAVACVSIVFFGIAGGLLAASNNEDDEKKADNFKIASTVLFGVGGALDALILCCMGCFACIAAHDA